jgi:hypothetical protein
MKEKKRRVNRLKFLLNVKEFKGKKLAIDTKKGCKIIFPSMLGFDKSWYGGRVQRLAEIEPGVCLCLDRHTMDAIDVLITDVEALEYFTLKEVAKLQGHNIPGNIKKEEILALFGIKTEAEGGEKVD